MKAGEVYYRFAESDAIHHLHGFWNSTQPENEPYYVFQAFESNEKLYLTGKSEVVHELPPIEDLEIGTVPQEKDRSYIESVQKAVSLIQADESPLEKVVLGRSLSIPCLSWDGLSAFQLICNTYPNAYVSLIILDDREWLFASPELLLKWKGPALETISLAGTISHHQKKEFTAKEKHEQALVSDFILETFKKNRLKDIHMKGPIEVSAGHLKHLCTFLSGTSHEEPLSLAYKLHPTPAVCGIPVDHALAFIKQNETINRSFYTGFQGVVQEQSGELFVNLRCLEAKNGCLQFYAGAGITADSDPEMEHNECREKMNTLLRVFEKTKL